MLRSRNAHFVCFLPAGLFVTFLLASCSDAGSGVAVQVRNEADGGLIGEVRLSERERTTHYDIQLHGLLPNAAYQVTLHGGGCENQSASFTRLSNVVADAAGNGAAQGRLLFRDQDDVELRSVADGAHVIVVRSEGLEACSVVPALGG